MKRRWYMIVLALVVLTGCRASAPGAAAVQAHYAELAGFTAHIKVIFDLDQAVMEYEMDYTYHKDDPDAFTITAPESLAGIGGTIAGVDSAQFSLQYDGMELDDAMPQRAGLTPADGLFCLLADLRSAEPVQQWSETVEGVKLLVLKYEEAREKETVEKQVWLTADGLRPVCAELYADGRCVLSIQVMQYQPTE